MQKIQKFMADRYGLDQLGVALLVLGCVITAALSFLRVPYYRLIGLLPMALSLWRALSKQREKRYAENLRFLRVWNPLRERAVAWWNRVRDRDHRYYLCPACKKRLRVPRGRGKIEISCPHCGTKFTRNTGGSRS